MIELTKGQQAVLAVTGHLLVTGGPGAGKTTVSILKAAKVARESLKPSQRVLFLSFARATVARVWDAIEEDKQISAAERKVIEVDTYHSFFWSIMKTHGYLVGLPRKLTIATPPIDAIALAQMRSNYTPRPTEEEKAKRTLAEHTERVRFAKVDGRICFDLFADFAGELLDRSFKIRRLIATMYPHIVLDEFQDTNTAQWRVVQALGKKCVLTALADPEQRIFDFIGADPARLNHFRETFAPTEIDLSGHNHRSKGTDIADFGNHVLTGRFRDGGYQGVGVQFYEANRNQAFASLAGAALNARERLRKAGKPDWTLAVLVPTKRMTRLVSDAFSAPQGQIPAIPHSAAVDMEGAILGAEILAFLMQPRTGSGEFDVLVDLVCAYFHGKGGDAPTQSALAAAASLRAAHEKALTRTAQGKPVPTNSIVLPLRQVFEECSALSPIGDPDSDWLAVRRALDQGPCTRLKEVAGEVRNVRLLDRGTHLRQALAEDWRNHGGYRNGLAITRQAFVQEHFARAQRPETGVIVMNMHKAKGKQFDEVIIFEGWPVISRGKIVANPDRIARSNERTVDMGQARQNLRVSITRAKRRTTILTPKADPCVLLLKAS